MSGGVRSKESSVGHCTSVAVRTGPRLTTLNQVMMKQSMPPSATCAPSAGAPASSRGSDSGEVLHEGQVGYQRASVPDSFNHFSSATLPNATATHPTAAAAAVPRADPKTFMAQLKSELPADLMRSVSGLLNRYTKEKDPQALIEGIAQLLKGPATVHLLQVCICMPIQEYYSLITL